MGSEMNPGQSVADVIGASAEFAARPFSPFLGTVVSLLPEVALQSIPEALSPEPLRAGTGLRSVLGVSATVAASPDMELLRVVRDEMLPRAGVRQADGIALHATRHQESPPSHHNKGKPSGPGQQ